MMNLKTTLSSDGLVLPYHFSFFLSTSDWSLLNVSMSSGPPDHADPLRSVLSCNWPLGSDLKTCGMTPDSAWAATKVLPSSVLMFQLVKLCSNPKTYSPPGLVLPPLQVFGFFSQSAKPALDVG